MFKKILFSILILNLSVHAQDTIRVKLTPIKKYNRVMVSELTSVNKKYVTFADVKGGEFVLVVPKGSPSGMYRLDYDYDNNLYVDFLYNNEVIDFEFNPEDPGGIITFNKSDENKLFQIFIDDISIVQNKLDATQVRYFQTKDANEEKDLEGVYITELKKLKEMQAAYHKKSEGKLAQHFITASNRYYNETLIKDTGIYLNDLKKHYFDYVDFNNKTLMKSSLLIDRVIDYILYLTNARDLETLTKLRKEAITFSLSKIEDGVLKKDIIQSIIFMFAEQENKALTDYIFENHFNKLPVALQDLEYKQMINDMFKTTIGQPAPEISWDIYGKSFNLYSLEKSEYYVVVFWSSSCPHCLKELPIYNTYLKDKKNIITLAVGLENEESQANWKEYTYDFNNLTHHILGLNKWKSKYSQDYGVTGTPSYFVLDSDKKIIAKPYDFEKLKLFFESKE